MTITEPRTYVFGPRDRRGFLLGLTGMQVGCLLAGPLFGLLALLVTGGSIIGVLAFGVWVVFFGAVALTPVAGQPLIEWVPDFIGYLLRDRSHQASARVGEFTPEWDIPEYLKDVRFLSVAYAGQQVGVTVDSNRYYTVTIKARGRGFALKDLPDQDALIQGWGDVIASTVNTPIDRVQVIESTLPNAEGGLDLFYQGNVAKHANPDAKASYERLIGHAGPAARDHEAHLVLRMDCERVTKQIKTAKEDRDEAASAILLRAISGVVNQLQNADVHVIGLLPPDTLATMFRDTHDPGRRLERATLAVNGVAVAADRAWPTASEDGWSTYRTDGAIHAIFIAEELPRSPRYADFMAPLMLGTGSVCRTVAITWSPEDDDKARRRAERGNSGHEADSTLRERWGFRTTSRRRREAQSSARHEDELAAGAASAPPQVTVIVHAPNDDQLAGDITTTQVASGKSGLKLRRFYSRQEEAFTWALPLGRMEGDRL